MGCFNGTCEISHLPIHAGDEIVLIPLMQHTEEYKTHNYNADDICTPFAFPIFGEYDDYGGIENVTLSPANKALFRSFEFYSIPYGKSTKDVTEGQNPVKYDDFSSDDEFLQEVICFSEKYGAKSLLNIGTTAKVRKLSFFMCHKELYQSLLEDIRERIPLGKTETFEAITQKETEAAMDESLEKARKMKEAAMRSEGKSFKELSESEDFELVFGLPSLLNDMAEEIFRFYRTRSKSCVKGMCAVFLEHPETREEVLQGATDLFFTTMILNYLRMGYGISSGLGSQCMETRLHVIVAEFILKTVKQRAEDNLADGYTPYPQGVREEVF